MISLLAALPCQLLEPAVLVRFEQYLRSDRRSQFADDPMAHGCDIAQMPDYTEHHSMNSVQ